MLRAHQIKKIEKHYPSSLRCDLLENVLAIEPQGLVMTIPEQLLMPERLTELLPANSSPVTEDEIFYHIERSAAEESYIRVEKQLLCVGNTNLNLQSKPLIEYNEQDQLALLPMILHQLAYQPIELQNFLRQNQASLGLVGTTVCNTLPSSFCHHFNEQDVQPAPKSVPVKRMGRVRRASFSESDSE